MSERRRYSIKFVRLFPFRICQSKAEERSIKTCESFNIAIKGSGRINSVSPNQITNMKTTQEKESIEDLKKKVAKLEQSLKECQNNPADLDRKRVEADDKSNEMFGLTCDWMEGIVSGVLSIDDGGDYVAWVNLRNILLSGINRQIREMINDDDYLRGLLIIGQISEKLHVLYQLDRDEKEFYRDTEYGFYNPEDENKFCLRYSQSIPRIILGSDKASDEYIDFKFLQNFNAFKKLREALELVREEFDYGDYHELKTQFDTFIWSLKYILTNYGKQ